MENPKTVKKWQVPSDLSEVQTTSAKVLSFFEPLKLSEAYQFDVRLCLEEALINAMKYGNKLDPRVMVELEAGFDEKRLWIQIEDRGAGFDVKKLGDCTQGDNILKNGGRGVHLIHKLMDQVEYNATGNQIRMVKNRGNHGS